MNMMLLQVDDQLLPLQEDNQHNEVDIALNLTPDKADKVKGLDQEINNRSPSLEKISRHTPIDKDRSKCIH